MREIKADAVLESLRLQFDSEKNDAPAMPEEVEAILKGRNRYKHLNWFNHMWQTRVYLKGSYHYLWNTRNFESAAQFADMAMLHFWDYRGWKALPSDNDFNTTLEHTKNLFKTWPRASTYLHALENHFVNIHGWQRRQDGKSNRTNVNTLSKQIAELSARLTKLEQQLTSIGVK